MSTSRILSQRDFREWEARLDAELKKPAAKIAWRILLEHHCDPKALKSVLYYAADHLRLAYEARHGNEFDAGREKLLAQVEQLKGTMRQLTTIQIKGMPIATWAVFFWGVKKNDMKFVQSFPALLVRLENILKVLKLPRARPDTQEDWLIASGELLLHLYVKEVTTKKFLEENAVLLEAAAVSTSLNYRQQYSTEAVSRRYRRFREREDSNYKAMQTLVKAIKPNKENFLDDFLDARAVPLFVESRY